ncbi:MAG: HAD-IA family hydrolase [Thermoprotei archaeon]
MALKVVLFDVEDTLLDVASGLQFGVRQILMEMGYRHPEQLETKLLNRALDMVGSARTLYELRVLLSLRTVFGSNIRLLRFSAKTLVWLDYLRTHGAQPVSGCQSVLVRLKDEGLSLGAVTDISSKMYRKLEARLPFLKEFETVVTRSEIRHTKPSPEGIVLALHRLGVAPSEAVYVGNMPSDVEAGRAAGVTTVWVPGALKPYLENRRLNIEPDFEVDSLKEAADVILERLLRSSRTVPKAETG